MVFSSSEKRFREVINASPDAIIWGECKVYACSTEHEVEHCRLCKDFPCSMFIGHFDPEHGQKSAIFRTGLLVYRKKAGTAKYFEMTKKTVSH